MEVIELPTTEQPRLGTTTIQIEQPLFGTVHAQRRPVIKDLERLQLVEFDPAQRTPDGTEGEDQEDHARADHQWSKHRFALPSHRSRHRSMSARSSARAALVLM
jgi:hypothetical protein